MLEEIYMVRVSCKLSKQDLSKGGAKLGRIREQDRPVWKRARRRGTIRTNRKLPKDHPFIPAIRANHCQLFLFIPFFYLFTYLFLLLLSRFFPPLLLPPASLFAIRT